MNLPSAPRLATRAKYMSVSARLKLSAVTGITAPDGVCANVAKLVAATKEHAQSGKTKAFIAPPITAAAFPTYGGHHILERIDVIHDRDLPRDHLANDVARFDVRGVDRGRAVAAGKLAATLLSSSLTRTANGAAT